MAPWKNPLVRMGIRRRLRRGPALTWAAVTLVASAFVYLIVYLTASERGLTSVQDAAKLAFTPIVVIQGILLMFMGTGAIASGIAEERASGLLDYHRLTPMSRMSKISGYLFGLPIREYFLFALTIPFVLFSIVAGEISLLRVAQLYLVFFTTVLLYHATGLAAGMLSKRPRSAALFARVLIVVLYVALPNLNAIGFSFLAYLTVVPTFRGLLGEELATSGASSEMLANFAGWELVPFFVFELSPTVYTLLLQGLLLATFVVLVHRKWRHEATHALSKAYAVGLYAAVQILVLGSLWPLLAGKDAFQIELNETTVLVALVLYLGLSAGLCLLLLQAVTPARADYVAGWRRAHRLGDDRPHWLADHASSTWVALALAAITACVLALLCYLAGAGPGLADPIPPEAIALAAAAFGGTAVTMQAARELWSSRVFALVLGGAWLLPGLAALLALSVWSAYPVAQYLGSLLPPVQYLYILAHGIAPSDAGAATYAWSALGDRSLTAASAAFSITPAVLLIALLRRAKRERRDLAVPRPFGPAG